MGATSEAELWELSRTGNGSAFGALFDLHQPRVFRAALRLSETTSDAEDLVASSFLELWRKRDRVRLVDESVLPWLLVTVNNLGRNAQRARMRHRRFLATLPPPSDEDVALDRVEELHAERDAMRFLRSLPPTDAAILVLTAFEGLSLRESAAALGISAESARARLSRARRRTRALLDTQTFPAERTAT